MKERTKGEADLLIYFLWSCDGERFLGKLREDLNFFEILPLHHKSNVKSSVGLVYFAFFHISAISCWKGPN